MAMTPEEYAAKEINVPGWETEGPVYAPGSNPSERDPNIAAVLNGGPVQPEPTPIDPAVAAMLHEYNFILPLELRRAELASEIAKQEHLSSRANFWNSLASFITSLAS